VRATVRRETRLGRGSVRVKSKGAGTAGRTCLDVVLERWLRLYLVLGVQPLPLRVVLAVVATCYREERKTRWHELARSSPPRLLSSSLIFPATTSHFINYFSRRAEAAARLLTGAPLQPATASASSGNGEMQGQGQGRAVKGCTFCEILRGEQVAFKVSFDIVGSSEMAGYLTWSYSQVYEDEHTLAFLGELVIYCERSPTPNILFLLSDILPIREGHLLVVPKLHYQRV
jgi:hypothetical protein